MWVNITEEENHLIVAALGQIKVLASLNLADRFRQELRQAKAPEVKLWRDKAFELHHVDGEVEVDDPNDSMPLVSIGEDGAYVMAWVFVSHDDIGACTECGAIPGTSEYGTVGDGYDGLCPSCADKAEESEPEVETPPAPVDPVELLRKLLVDERTEKIKAIDDADPDVGMGRSLESMRQDAIVSLKLYNHIPADWTYPENTL